MKYVLLLISCIFGITLGISNVFADCGDGNLTSTEFKICPSQLSPISTGISEAESTPREFVMSLLKFISKILLYLIPTLAALSGVVAGYYYIFSNGDSENTSRAKTIIKYNLTAIALAIASYSIILFITTLLG